MNSEFAFKQWLTRIKFRIKHEDHRLYMNSWHQPKPVLRSLLTDEIIFKACFSRSTIV